MGASSSSLIVGGEEAEGCEGIALGLFSLPGAELRGVHFNQELAGMISQGCTPVGQSWTITRAERNIILELRGRPAYEILTRTLEGMSPEEQERARGNFFVGLVVNEYQDEFLRGDFLIRNLVGVDPRSGRRLVRHAEPSRVAGDG
jgi:small ligand-binding sensory domain FIST